MGVAGFEPVTTLSSGKLANQYTTYFQVITDGLRIEVISPQLVHGRGCGLCGDLDGENTADLKTPRTCIMKKNKYG